MNQQKRLLIIISMDTTNCYNRIAHPIASIVCEAQGLPLGYLLILFGTIQVIKIHLRTGYRVSQSSYTGTKLRSFQGGVQGNRVVLVL